MNLKNFKNKIFTYLYGKRGFPIVMEEFQFKIHESLRRWNFDSEQELRAAFRDSIKSGNTVFDIGANFGLHSMYLSKLVGQKGRVFAFEPIPRNVVLLQKNIELNSMVETVTVINSAVSNSSSPKIKMNLPSDEVAVSASIIFENDQHSSTSVSVDNIRLDEFVIHNDIVPDFIKVDVEGAEFEVLKGAKKIIEKYHPLILVEIHSFALPDFKATPQHIEEFFQKLGYKEHKISRIESLNGSYYHSLFSYFH